FCPEMIIRTIYLPKLVQKELDRVVKYEIEQLIPSGTGGYTSDYMVLGEEMREGAVQQKVLIAALPSAIVGEYMDLFWDLNLKPQVFDFHGNSVSRVVNMLKNSNKGERQLVVDAGASTTTITFVENGAPVFTRLLQKGGGELTRPFANTFNLSLEDIFRSVEFYKSRSGNDLDSVIVAGGGSRLEGFGGFIATNLGLEEVLIAEALPPLAKGRFSPEQAVVYINALGLALGEAKDRNKSINLLPGDYRDISKKRRAKRIKVLAGILAGAIAAGAVILPLYYRDSLKSMNTGIQHEIEGWARVMEHRQTREDLERLLAQREEMANSLRSMGLEWSTLFEEIERCTPYGVRLESVSYSKDGTIEIHGIASGYNSVARFVVALRSAQKIKAAEPVSIVLFGDDVHSFEVRCRVGGE
ncbi:MAG: pilus assembly protein PilM, partial [Clostridiales bacterium]|nr:pilus assembly protein PilM [Clostridiales bacterium]